MITVELLQDVLAGNAALAVNGVAGATTTVASSVEQPRPEFTLTVYVPAGKPVNILEDWATASCGPAIISYV